MLDLIRTHGTICRESDGIHRLGGSRPGAILPGSFNPLHRGHTSLAAAAAAYLGIPVAFELSLANVDKPEMAPAEAERRLAQFSGVGAVWVTRAATFAAKAAIFPGAAFVLGFDTATRLVDPKYYRGDPDGRDECLRRLLSVGCRVVVGGRLDASDTFRTWDAAGLPEEFQPLFVALAEADFRADVSSTELRSTP